MEQNKKNFNIKDLEHLSGVKAHTIRMWERRYDLLKPERSETNIRSYDLACLQKILNVSFLNEQGYKISRIANLSRENLADLVKEVAESVSLQAHAINALKISMINFDTLLFHKTYETLMKQESFQSICHNIFLPLLDEMGILWEEKTIDPVHEQFITGLIRQKLYMHISLLEQEQPSGGDELYVLFLPENETQDLGLLFLNYELQLFKRPTIFLVPSLPMTDMKYLLELHTNLKFISYLTNAQGDFPQFLSAFETELCLDKKRELHLFGSPLSSQDISGLPSHIKVYKSIPEFSKNLQ